MSCWASIFLLCFISILVHNPGEKGGIAFLWDPLTTPREEYNVSKKISSLKQFGAFWKLYGSYTWTRAVGWDLKKDVRIVQSEDLYAILNSASFIQRPLWESLWLMLFDSWDGHENVTVLENPLKHHC